MPGWFLRVQYDDENDYRFHGFSDACNEPAYDESDTIRCGVDFDKAGSKDDFDYKDLAEQIIVAAELISINEEVRQETPNARCGNVR